MVLWPDDDTSASVRAIWDDLEACGVPSLHSHTHGLHVPHVSMMVSEHLPVAETLAAVGPVPAQRIPLLVEAAGVFPEGALVPRGRDERQLDRRAAAKTGPFEMSPWTLGRISTRKWTPHLTCAWSRSTPSICTPRSPIVLVRLPLRGWLDRGGVEDGTTGEQWPVTARS